MSRICIIHGPGVIHTEHRSSVKFNFVSNLRSGVRIITRLLGTTPIDVPDDADIEPHVLAANAVLRDGDLYDPQIFDRCAGILEATIEEVLQRYQAAYRRGEAIRPAPQDKMALSLNRLVWRARSFGARWQMFPDEPSGWPFEPTDPGCLNCDLLVDHRIVTIENARVRGAYEAAGGGRDLFQNDDDVGDVVICLDHDYPQVRYATTLAEAQAIWRGNARLNARVRIEGEAMPEVIGGITLLR